MKKGLKKTTTGSAHSRLAKTLFSYRLTPQSTTGISSAEFLFGRRPRSRLDLLKPNTADRVEHKQQKQKEQHDAKARNRCFAVGDDVFVLNYQTGERWLPGVICTKTGPVSFIVKLTDGRERRCHQDQIRKRTLSMDTSPEPEIEITSGLNEPFTEVSFSPDTTTAEPPINQGITSTYADMSSATPILVPEEVVTSPASPIVAQEKSAPSPPAKPPVKTYPKRARVPVNRFKPTW